MPEEIIQPEKVKVEKEFKRPDYLDPVDKKGYTKAERSGHAFGLSDRQTAYLHEYLVDFSPSRAGRALGLTKGKWQSWLKLPQFVEAIDAYLEKRRRENEDLVRKTLSELMAVMTSDIRDFVTWHANNKIKIIPSKFLKNSKAIKGIHKTRTGIKLTLHDKVRGIELMMQGLGMMKKAKEEKIMQPGEKDESLETSLLEALTKAHEERKALPQMTGGSIEIPSRAQDPEETEAEDKDEAEAEEGPSAGDTD